MTYAAYGTRTSHLQVRTAGIDFSVVGDRIRYCGRTIVWTVVLAVSVIPRDADDATSTRLTWLWMPCAIVLMQGCCIGGTAIELTGYDWQL